MKQRLARAFLSCAGWQVDPYRPTAAKFVLIAAPHTSNWDLPFMLAMGWVLGVKAAWLGKHQIFYWPVGILMRWLGGIPVRRDRRANRVDQMIELMDRSNDLVLVIPPEGTRGRAPFWKSGFYHVARGAKVPIVMGYLDFSRRIGGFGPELVPTGDMRRDMDAVRAFYADKVGKRPHLFGAVRLREEVLPEVDAT